MVDRHRTGCESTRGRLRSLVSHPEAALSRSGPSPRVLVFTASVGEGHDVPARALAAGIRRLRADAEVELVDALDVIGGLVRRVAEDDLRRTFGAGRLNWVFDLQYLLFARAAPLRLAGQAALHRAGGRRVLEAIEQRAPDVVVSVYPVMTEVLGWLRRTHRLRVPAVGAITDLSSLWYWASRGIDLQLVTHPESIPEATRIAGGSRVVAAHGLYDPRFLRPPARSAARRALGLEPTGAVVAVSGGGWGVGDVDGAVRTALEVPGATVLALCGRNETLRRRLGDVFPDDRLQALPFVEDMATTLAAADVLVHSTAGLTVLEALLAGCAPISYGWGIAHIRVNNRAYRRLGMAAVVRTRAGLRHAIDGALARPQPPLASRFAELPDAAELVLELV